MGADKRKFVHCVSPRILCKALRGVAMHGAYRTVFRAWWDAELTASQATYRLAGATSAGNAHLISKEARFAGDLHVQAKGWFAELMSELRIARG